MTCTNRIVLLIPVAVSLVIAGPPGGYGSSGGGGHTSGGGQHGSSAAHYGSSPYSGTTSSISGPAPLGASGPAPVGASGSFFPSRYPAGANGSLTPGRGNHGGQVGGRRPYQYGLLFAPYAYGYGDYGNGYYDNGDYTESPNYQTNNTEPQVSQSMEALDHTVRQLTAEIEKLNSQQQQTTQDPSPELSSPPPMEQDPQSIVPVTLVLQNGRKLQVRNYAVTDGLFWDFSKQPATKIPVSSIDVAASVKATQAEGGEFPDLRQ